MEDVLEGKDTRRFLDWDQVVHMAEFGQDTMPGECRSSREDRSSGYGSGSNHWAGGTFEQGMEMAKNGWPEGTKKMLDVRDDVWARISDRIIDPQPVYDVCGAVPDVAAFLGGEPECMLRVEDEERVGTHGNVLEIVINIGALSDVEAEEINFRGAGIASIIDVLEQLGYYCNVTLVSRATDYGGKCGIRYDIYLKGSSEPFDVDKFAFAVISPAMLRRVIFSLRECENEEVRGEVGIKECGGYGRSSEVSVEEGVLYFPLTYDLNSNEQVFDFVVKTLTDIGIEIGEGDE